MQTVKLSQLKLGPNVRQSHDQGSIAEMANSIKVVGVLQNLLVRPARRGYEVIFGGRRYKALQVLLEAGQIAKDYEVPVEVRKLDDAEAARLGLIENLFRENMEPLEEAEAFYQAVQQGISVADLALKTGFGERLIRQRVTLAERLHPEVKTFLKDGELTLEQAQALTLIEPEDQVGFLEDWSFGFDPESLRYSLGRSVLGVADAIFPLERYHGVIVEDLFGEAAAHFADQEQARGLQLGAAGELKSRLEAQGYDPVLLTQTHGIPRWQYREPKEGEGQGGAVVNLHPNTLKVETLEGVVPYHPEPAPALSLPIPQAPSATGLTVVKPKPLLSRKGAANAKNLKTLALQRGLVGETGGIQVALAVAVLGLLGEGEVYLRDAPDRSGDDKDLLDPKVATVHELFAAKLPKTRMGEGGLELDVHSPDPAETFKALVGLPREELEALFTALLARRVGSWNSRYSYEPSAHDSPFAVTLAEHLAVRLTWTDIPAEFWKSFSKERVAQVVGSFNPAYTHIPFATRKEAIGTLRELTKVKPDQPLPEELQFQTRSGTTFTLPDAAEVVQEELEAEAA